ncbi:FAD-dependent monooxygenase [Streptomyces coeruleofuscus]|uniref:FAD-dependent monooxygenase n=1 Tax=Streptomyces coeruleofuscus TaxID=66879 RepID=A0ABP5USQ0_9ACTN
MEKTEVVVVGSGPTGLLLAAELALAGVDVVVLDKLPERRVQAKALNLQPRTAEVLDLRGLLDDAHERAIATVAEGHFARLPVPLRYDGWSARRPYQVGIPQARVEELLEERLLSHGTRVRYGHELVGLVQDSTGVTATVRVPNGDERTLRAAYLAACDGGRSTVRKLLGVPFPGTDARAFGIVADVVLGQTSAEVPTRWTSTAKLFAHTAPAGQVTALIPLDEPGHYQLFTIGPDIRPESREAPVSKAELETALRISYGEEAEITEVRQATRFTDASRQVERYRVGRVLLAGDAAHIHLLAGAQGMNLGIQDAMNLGWKLAAEVLGRAPEGLLDSYHAERHPVAAEVLENTRAQGLFMFAKEDPGVDALRGLFTELLALPQVNRYLAGRISGLGIRYPMDGADTGPSHELLGARMPDIQLADDVWAGELLHTGCGVLLTVDSAFVDAARPWSDRVEAVLLPEIPLTGEGADALLIRPDGYVCWTAPAKSDLETALTTWFGTPA